jgi:hypothetical protein
VSIPADYNNQKGRCCRYVVISEISDGKPLPPKAVYTNNDVSPQVCEKCGWSKCKCKQWPREVRMNVWELLNLYNNKIKRYNKFHGEYEQIKAVVKSIERLGAVVPEKYTDRLLRLNEILNNMEVEMHTQDRELTRLGVAHSNYPLHS